MLPEIGAVNLALRKKNGWARGRRDNEVLSKATAAAALGKI